MQRAFLQRALLNKAIGLTALGLFTGASMGCTIFGNPKASLDAELSKPTSATAATTPGQQSSKYSVIFQPSKGSPETFERSLSQPTTVQQVVEQSGALKKFRRIEVELVRPLASGGFHKIPCEYDRSTKRINPEFDYALLPGDKVMVIEDPTNILDDIMRSANGGLGKRFSTGGRKNTSNKVRIEG